MAATTTKSVTEKLADWVVAARYEDVPAAGIDRVRERFVDSIGVQFAGMRERSGETMASWVRDLGAVGESSVVGNGFKTSPSLAAFANATAGHALDFDDSSTFTSHPSNPLTAGILAVGEAREISGRDAILAFMVGWEIICRTNQPMQAPEGHVMLLKGQHNQGYQPALGVAAATAKLMGLDVLGTCMAMGNAASTMSGMHKNAGSDTKPFHAGNPCLHGIMASELVARGFTASPDIMDGDWGVARSFGLHMGDAEKMLDGLGDWDLAQNGSWLKMQACSGAGQWAMTAMQSILDKHPAGPDDIESVEVHAGRLLVDEMHHHLPQTGLQGKFSFEYDIAVVVLDGRGGMAQYADAMVQRPEAQELMGRVRVVLLEGEEWRGSRVIVKFRDGTTFDETCTVVHGQPTDPPSNDEIRQKFDDCSGWLIPESQRDDIVEMCWKLDSLGNLRELGDLVRSARS